MTKKKATTKKVIAKKIIAKKVIAKEVIAKKPQELEIRPLPAMGVLTPEQQKLLEKLRGKAREGVLSLIKQLQWYKRR